MTPKRTPSVPTTLYLKLVMRAEMKFLTRATLLWPTLDDSSTRNTMSACTTVLHAERVRGKKPKNEYVQTKSFDSLANHQIAVLLYCGSFNFHHVPGELHKSPECLMNHK